MNENRLVEIETQLAHQENTIETLNQVVIKQELLVYQLEAKIEALIKEISVERKAEKQKTTRNEKPPHY